MSWCFWTVQVVASYSACCVQSRVTSWCNHVIALQNS